MPFWRRRCRPAPSRRAGAARRHPRSRRAQRRSAAAPESIAAIFSLPDATARLIAALAEGVEAKSYAEQQGITMDAVKFHLKTAFAKTGLRSQARLLQAVARALADLSARRRADE